MSDFSHIDDWGQARMVDVGDKAVTRRLAEASASVRTRKDVIEAIRGGQIPKGDVLAVARLAGIQAAKRTADLIPLCHPLALEQVVVDLQLEDDRVRITSRVLCSGKTGVEMEALCAVSVAALALIDMCKSADRAMVIEHVRVEKKSGGKSGEFIRQEEG